jgi:threonylcarbamoyladenosine tRNA methylthiotransferase MtaB
LARSALAYRQRYIGQEVQVLWESSDRYGPEGWRMHGLSGNYVRVESVSSERVWNKISQVRLEGQTLAGMSGTILDVK